MIHFWVEGGGVFLALIIVFTIYIKKPKCVSVFVCVCVSVCQKNYFVQIAYNCTCLHHRKTAEDCAGVQCALDHLKMKTTLELRQHKK